MKLRNAFTLIELAVVMTIVGLALGGTLKLFKMYIENQRKEHIRTVLDETVNTIHDHMLQYPHDLPTYTELNRTLNYRQIDTILYVTADGTDVNDSICSINPSTDLAVEMYGYVGAGPALQREFRVSGVAYAVVHKGINLNMQTTVEYSGTHNIVKIYRPDVKVDNNNSDPLDTNLPYDDIVRWETLDKLKRLARCYDNPLRIVNTSLPDAEANVTATPYKATIAIDGNYSAPTSSSCTFSSDYDDDFKYYESNMTIQNKPSFIPFMKNNIEPAPGTAVVTCSVTADNKTVKKTFTITINP